MAQAIVWTRFSAADLEQITAYIRHDSETYAAVVAEQVMEATDRLSMFPMMGRVVSEFDRESIREVLVYSYRVIYPVEADRIVVAAIIHGARDLQTALSDRPTLSQ